MVGGGRGWKLHLSKLCAWKRQLVVRGQAPLELSPSADVAQHCETRFIFERVAIRRLQSSSSRSKQRALESRRSH